MGPVFEGTTREDQKEAQILIFKKKHKIFVTACCQNQQLKHKTNREIYVCFTRNWMVALSKQTECQVD